MAWPETVGGFRHGGIWLFTSIKSEIYIHIGELGHMFWGYAGLD